MSIWRMTKKVMKTPSDSSREREDPDDSVKIIEQEGEAGNDIPKVKE